MVPEILQCIGFDNLRLTERSGKGDSTSLWPWQWRTDSHYITSRFWSFEIVCKTSDLPIICQKYPVFPATTLGRPSGAAATESEMRSCCTPTVAPRDDWHQQQQTPISHFLPNRRIKDDIALWIPRSHRQEQFVFIFAQKSSVTIITYIYHHYHLWWCFLSTT